MSRPIVLTEEMKQQAREDVSALLDGLKMSDGKLNYCNSFTYKDTKAVVWLTPEAYKKTLALGRSSPMKLLGMGLSPAPVTANLP